MKNASTAAMVFLAVLLVPSLVSGVFTFEIAGLIAAVLRIVFLLLAAVYATRCYRSFEASNPVKGAWLLLLAGTWGFAGAQSILAFYQIGLRVDAPFPSLADAFFLPGTLLLAASLARFVWVYRRVGFPIATRNDLTLVLGATGVIVTAFVFVVARPVLESQATLVETALNIAYPTLDFLLLVPAVLLLRMALGMRGGRLWEVWMALVLGFICLAVGDILFAFFTSLGQSALDPLLDLLFGWSYILMARGLAAQVEILRTESTAT